MARRAATSLSTAPAPSFLSKSQPGRRGQLTDPNESAFSRFLREEVFAPEKLPGNISMVTGLGLFVGGILAVRSWGDLLIPA
ncbi:hypothetical protein F5876DRAFT_34323 [Lentinula aff. lateritia]|uniref:Uncharacterized protein n=1 Tax=Lentinula aff. lateritia TaxID=2804960 RepID=A0ACC1UAJ6_9AGAR|nr:hypothetical protein F5876DRAFT_34323 [Lentinula aff. lateritia]